MALADRMALYRELEQLRKRPLIVYVTSPREGAGGEMSADVIPEFCDQLEAIPNDSTGLDLLVVSDGGDPMVALRIVSLIRERVNKFAMLVPSAAYSAATLLALGADEIIIHPNGNLGPVDPQIVMRDKQGSETAFGVEDMNGFLEYIRDDVGLTDQEHVRAMLEMFCRQMSPAFVGKAARAAFLSRSVGEKLLLMHMPKEDQQKPKRIIEALNKSFYHHGYPINRNEVQQNELPLAPSSAEVRQAEKLIWKIWIDLEKELEFRRPFDPGLVLFQSPNAAKLLDPIPQLNLPADTPEEVVNQVMAQVMANALEKVSPVAFEFTPVVVESVRRATHYRVRGSILASRLPNLTIQSNVLFSAKGWETLPIPAA
jgi:Serine dehydrogenase proteinase